MLNNQLSRMVCSGFAAVVLTSAAAWHPQTLAQNNLLRGNALNENSLIKALTPRPDGVVSRGIAVRKKADASGSASLLITFKINSAEISESAKSELDIVAGALKSNELSSFKFSIEGHADPRGESQFNLYLSQQRAESVVQYLTSAHDLPRERLLPIGKGDSELMRPDRPSAPENRRVTIKTEAN